MKFLLTLIFDDSYNISADLNNDNVIDALDIIILINQILA